MGKVRSALASGLRSFGRASLKVLEREKKSQLIQQGKDRNLYKTSLGDLLWLNAKNCIDRAIIRNGLYEEHSTAAARHLIKGGDIVFDIGANIGYYSVLFSRLVGPSGRVHCFEPTQAYRQVLKANLAANKTTNVDVYDFGFSNSQQELEITFVDSTATLHHPGHQVTQGTEKINLRTLNQFIKEYQLPKIDFIKIDVDGHEPLVLEGAWDLIDRYDPVLMIEISHLHYLEAGITAWDFYSNLKKRGYRIYHEENLAEITSKQDFLIKCGNFAFSANIVISRRDLRPIFEK
jgi:FkbM family methyltransferase